MVRVVSPWEGVPNPEPLKNLVKTAKDPTKDFSERQRAVNLLLKSIQVMETVKGRKPICDYLNKVIGETRQDIYK